MTRDDLRARARAPSRETGSLAQDVNGPDATLPLGIGDAELFGNTRNYPNAGMPERPGLFGQANGGVLFFDEIAELPVEQQAHLLRVLDADGEYQRLGEATTGRSDVLLIAATNRDLSALKNDFRARFTTVVELAPLSSRSEDVPLLARHLLGAAARRSPEVAGRFLEKDAAGRPRPRFAASFIAAEVRHQRPGARRAPVEGDGGIPARRHLRPP
jgi:transcriptional regulator of aromatic amino acid metabolism